MARSRKKPQETAIFQILSPVRLPFRHTGCDGKTLVVKRHKRKREIRKVLCTDAIIELVAFEEYFNMEQLRGILDLRQIRANNPAR